MHVTVKIFNRLALRSRIFIYLTINNVFYLCGAGIRKISVLDQDRLVSGYGYGSPNNCYQLILIQKGMIRSVLRSVPNPDPNKTI